MNTAGAAIRLILVDDHALFREGLAELLSRVPGMEVVGRCSNVAEALAASAELQPDVILLDYDLGSERALDFIQKAKLAGRVGRILVVTAGVADAEAVQLVQAGVAGILHKHNSPAALCDTIRQVAAGEVCLEQRYLRPLFQTVDQSDAERPVRLTDRDRAVMRMIFQGLANKEIGVRLGVSEGAIKASLRQLFQKLNVHTRAQLVKVALEQYRDQL